MLVTVFCLLSISVISHEALVAGHKPKRKQKVRRVEVRERLTEVALPSEVWRKATRLE